MLAYFLGQFGIWAADLVASFYHLLGAGPVVQEPVVADLFLLGEDSPMVIPISLLTDLLLFFLLNISGCV
jgi:hypothetical protein